MEDQMEQAEKDNPSNMSKEWKFIILAVCLGIMIFMMRSCSGDKIDIEAIKTKMRAEQAVIRLKENPIRFSVWEKLTGNPKKLTIKEWEIADRYGMIKRKIKNETK